MRKSEIKVPTGIDWKETLMLQLRKIQNSPEYKNQDIMTFSGFCNDRYELYQYVKDRAAA